MKNYFEFDLDLIDQLDSLRYDFKNRYLLNCSNDNFDILEKFIFDTAVFHLNCDKDSIKCETNNSSLPSIIEESNELLREEININDYYIEFWIKKTPLLNNLHVDCDEYEKHINNKMIYPIKSIISYLNNHLYPTLITNIDIENYTYKSFERENNIKLIFPKKNTQISFDGSKYHGEIKLNEISNSDINNERFIIAMNIWHHKPLNIDFYESKFEPKNKIYNKKDNLLNLVDNCQKYTIIADKQLSEAVFDKLLFKDDHSICLLFSNEIQNCITNNIYYIDILDSSIYNSNLPQSVCIMKEIENSCTDDIKIDNRFLQRFTYNNFFSTEICKWIIFEANETGDKYGWNVFRHKYNPTIDIPLQIINPVFKFCAFTFINLFKQIFKSYCIPEKYTTNIKEMFIVKYDVSSQKSLNTHKDGTHLSLNIMLSDINDYEGGGTYFEDGLTYYLNRGDVLVHSGHTNHGSHDIIKGLRYIIIVFFDIIER
jgi:hypothetical protein